MKTIRRDTDSPFISLLFSQWLITRILKHPFDKVTCSNYPFLQNNSTKKKKKIVQHLIVICLLLYLWFLLQKWFCTLSDPLVYFISIFQYKREKVFPWIVMVYTTISLKVYKSHPIHKFWILIKSLRFYWSRQYRCLVTYIVM